MPSTPSSSPADRAACACCAKKSPRWCPPRARSRATCSAASAPAWRWTPCASSADAGAHQLTSAHISRDAMNVFAQPIVMIDFETTGLSPDMGDRITEVAALRIAGGRVVDRYVSLINCGVRIPSFITGLTGITQAMVDGAPPVAQVLPRLLDFIGADALSAHNASFDEKFLKARRRGWACRRRIR